MTKAELIDAISKAAGITKKESEIAVNTFTDSITKALKKGTKVTLVGFGTFSSVKRKGRTCKPPGATKVIKVPPKRVPKFNAGAKLKAAVK
ncbi:MAG: HU family DNA-binding protein [bacterium]|nr:HU family DNA-binding protein [bacterium]